ncbi:MAG: polysaccharide lyase family 7 protein [Chitinophagaceae bacterium]
MRKTTSIKTTGSLYYACLFLLFLSFSCAKQPATREDSLPGDPAPAEEAGPSAAKAITILNPGFESDKANWGDASLFAISTSDKHSGSKSAKLSSSGNRIQQAITVLANTNYTLTAWILGKGTIGAKNGSTVLNSQGGTYSAWTQVTVAFNSGSATSVTLYGAYNAGEGRFDDFALDEEESGATPPAAPSGLSATASGTSAINLAWTDNSATETGFKLERKTGSGGTYTEIAGSIAANTTTYSNTGLTANTTYYYRLRSYNAAGNSSYSSEVSATTTPAGGNLPADVLNLANWKITLPFDGSDGNSDADEVKQPDLATYSHATYFHNNTANTGVIFQAHTGGATTSGSSYPRSELREMTGNGATNASWSSGSGTHTMEIDQAITHLPVEKPHIVAGQIHDGGDDVIVFRLEGQKLFIDINGDDGPTLTSGYVLGTRFRVKFVVSNNQTQCYYNDVLKYTLNQSYSGAYFKAGAYTQSSCKPGKNPGPDESCDAYGEVVIYNVTVSHQ